VQMHFLDGKPCTQSFQVFDVGAREDLAFYNMKKDCDYHLFEPNKDFVKRLKKQISSLKEHSITVNEFSLADKNQENYTYYEKSQSFEINPYMKEDTETGDHYSVKTLDGYVAEKNIPHIDFLKIDAEGFDYKIIEGGLNLIKNDGVSYIQFEYWTGVKKFVDILGDTYNLYLIMEPVLLSGIQIKIAPLMNSKQRLVNYRKSLIKLDSNLIDLIDKKLAPIGLGGNILGIHKNIDEYEVEKLIFDVIEFAPKTPLLSKVGYKVKEIIRKSWPVTFASKIGGAVIESRTKRGWLSLQEITEYRKTIKIYDVFSFFNELDLLEIRLNILDAYVDYFVIVEATETFSGYPKPLYFKENKNRFKKWEHKIIHYVIDDTPTDESDLRSRLYQGNLSRLDRQIIHDSLTSSNIGKGVLHWFKEFYQKEVIKKALIDLNDNDICYISDLDEIWNPELLIDYSKDDVFKPIQIGYQYYLNNRSNEDWQGWTGTIITKYKNIKYDCLNHLRTHRKMRSTYTFLKNGGWHFAFQGGYDGAKTKIEEYKHFWYNPRGILPNLKMRVSENKDHRGRKNIKLWKDERGLPKFLLENKNKYKKFFK
jgi:beta-1,4-mannosyl-glycoprotein beta-1,4-N-acetylglucosaminyltransferase